MRVRASPTRRIPDSFIMSGTAPTHPVNSCAASEAGARANGPDFAARASQGTRRAVGRDCVSGALLRLTISPAAWDAPTEPNQHRDAETPSPELTEEWAAVATKERTERNSPSPLRPDRGVRRHPRPADSLLRIQWGEGGRRADEVCFGEWRGAGGEGFRVRCRNLACAPCALSRPMNGRSSVRVFRGAKAGPGSTANHANHANHAKTKSKPEASPKGNSSAPLPLVAFALIVPTPNSFFPTPPQSL